MAVELIATQSELSTLVSALRRGEDGDGLRVTSGWRARLVGDELRELAAGEVALSANPAAASGSRGPERREAASVIRAPAPPAARPRRSSAASRRCGAG